MKHALLLDDNIAQLTVRELVLRQASIESHVATNAQSALALLRSEAGRAKIGTVITDHLMPGMDGVALCKAVRNMQLDGYVYALLLTARDRRVMGDYPIGKVLTWVGWATTLLISAISIYFLYQQFWSMV